MRREVKAVLLVLAALRPRLRVPFTIAGAAIFFSVFAWFLGWLLIGDDSLPVRWGAYIAPWLAAVLILAFGLLLFVGRWWIAAVPLLLALLVLSPVLPRFSPARWAVPTTTEDLRVMTFNTSMWNADVRGIADLIARERPDIVFLQQTSDMTSLRAALARISGRFPFYSAPRDTADTIILSRFKLLHVQEYRQRTTAVAAIGTCRLRLWDFHAPHGQFDIEDQERYFADAGRDLRGETLPIISGGDLNSTEFNSAQAPLRSRLRDAFADVGAGLGFTFPSSVRHLGLFGALFRIDHIFYRGLQPLSAQVIHGSAGSDHFPVTATFRIGEKCRISTVRHRSSSSH